MKQSYSYIYTCLLVDWKEAKMIIQHKKGDIKDIKNYRYYKNDRKRFLMKTLEKNRRVLEEKVLFDSLNNRSTDKKM